MGAASRAEQLGIHLRARRTWGETSGTHLFFPSFTQIYSKTFRKSEPSLQICRNFQPLLLGQLMIPENSGKARKKEQLPVAGRVSRVSSVSLWIWEESSLQNSAKAKTSQGLLKVSGEKKNLENHRGLLSIYSLVHLNVSGFVPTFLYVDKTISSKNIPHDHWKHWDYGNSWLRLYWEQSKYMNHIQFPDFLSAVAAHVSKAEECANCLLGCLSVYENVCTYCKHN